MRNRHKVVAAFLDGRRLKGFLFDFSPLRGYFFLFPEHDGSQQPGARGLMVRLAELKALFFVKEFAGNPNYAERAIETAGGEKVEVIFSDGETRTGLAESADAGTLGFFLVPSDPQSNNERVFVVSANVRQLRPVAALASAQHG